MSESPPWEHVTVTATTSTKLRTTRDLLTAIRKSEALSAEALDAIVSQVSDLPEDPVHAANALVKTGVLTAFQARMFLAGKTKGFRLGDYVIKDQIGQGGMGAVYLAEHQTLQRKVAIKVLLPDKKADQLTIERFLREARTAAALDHPNIVRLFDIGKQGDILFLVMEYVHGQTLDKLLVNGPLALGRAVSYIAQAAAGLQHAHEKGFIHRDIKPGNLILSKDGTLKLLDMGLARSHEKADNVTEVLDRGAVVGTADYVSPEQAMNETELDIRSDIYSLGVTFYVMVAGRPPFDGSTANKLLLHQLKDPPSLTSLDRTFPKELSKIISKMMAKRPGDRFQTPAEVIEALEPWLNDSRALISAMVSSEATAKKGVTTRQVKRDTSRQARRKKLLIGAGAGVGVLLLVILTAVFWPSSSQDPGEVQSRPPVAAGGPAGGDASAVPGEGDTQQNTPPRSPQQELIAAHPILKKNWVDGPTVYKLDLEKQLPFDRIVGATDHNTDATKTIEQQLDKRGAGDVPEHWSVITWSKGHEARSFAELTVDGPHLGLQSRKGNAMLFLTLPDPYKAPALKVRLTYKSTCSPSKLTIRFRQMGLTTTENYNIPASTTWTTTEFLFDSSKVTEPRVEFHNSDSLESAAFYIRGLEVIEAKPAP